MATFRTMAWWALTILTGAEARGGDEGAVARVARWFSPEYRRIEQRRADMGRELNGLPSLAPRPFASRYGFRSETLTDPDQAQWLQIDFEQPRMIDRIVAVPAHIPALGERGAGYGFPLRFRIEVSNNPDMGDATVVVDQTGADVPNPGRYPVDFRIKPTTARYVRFTSTRHFSIDGGFLWALEELLALSGNQSAATLHPVTASSSLELFPNWSRSRIQDGQSALGLPVTTEPSPNRGYLSAITTDPMERKWLGVDLGNEFALDEIRLVAVESDNFQTRGESSFPRGWALELATDPGFNEIVWSEEKSNTNLVGFPGDCAAVIPVYGKRGRYLRISTLALWGTDLQYGYALAEFQAYAGNVNVALGKPATASDMDKIRPGGDPSSVTDGFSSRHRLVEMPEYLDLIGRRGRLERESQVLVLQQAGILDLTGQILGYGGAVLGTLLVLGWAWLLGRQRTLRQRAVTELREQIARDLHDDIGSNLGGIVLLSEIGSRHSDDARTRADFSAIKEAADETSASMRDIVWLIQRGHMGLRDLVAKMRQSTQAILGDKEISLTVEPAGFRDLDLSLLFRRHVFFAFKETLNNVRKHAGATSVEVCITIESRHLVFTVRDDGVGFDPQGAVDPGHGLGNLMRRAARLHGNCDLESRPGQGTFVSFKVPLKSRSR